MINWKNCNPLSDKDLADTAELAITGDRQAIERLVQANVKLASALAHQYSDFGGMNTDDLTSEALIGLIEAIPNFDPKRGTKFTTYASWRMRMRVLRFVLDNFRLVKIGTTQAQRKIFWRLNRETEALRREGSDPTDEALADRIDVKAHEVQAMQIRMSESESSLNATSDRGGSLFETLPHTTPTPEQYVTSKRMVSWVQARMVEFEQRLDGTEKQVWNHRIASEEPLSLQEVGERIGTSRQYASQIERRLNKQFTKYARNHV